MTHATEIPDIDTYLNQTEVWSSAAGDMFIKDMDEVYRRRACDWLLRNTTNLHQLRVLEMYERAEEEPTLAEKLQWADIRPFGWIRRTPLFLALSEGIDPALLRRTGTR